MSETDDVYNGALPVELPEHQEAERTARVLGKVSYRHMSVGGIVRINPMY